MNEFFTYVIYNELRKKIYIGHSNNLCDRIKRHNGLLPNKSRSYTKINGSNWKLIYSEKFFTRKEAIRREKELKSFQGRKFIREYLKNIKD